MNEMLTVKTVGERYHIGRNRIYNAIQTRELRAYRPNCRSYLLDPTDVERWIKQFEYSPICRTTGIKR